MSFFLAQIPHGQQQHADSNTSGLPIQPVPVAVRFAVLKVLFVRIAVSVAVTVVGFHCPQASLPQFEQYCGHAVGISGLELTFGALVSHLVGSLRSVCVALSANSFLHGKFATV